MKFKLKYIENNNIEENLILNFYHLKWYLKFKGFIYSDINIIKYKKNTTLTGETSFKSPFKILINQIH